MNHSKMSSWEPMRGEPGEGGGSFRKIPNEPVGGGVRQVPGSPRKRTINHQSPCKCNLSRKHHPHGRFAAGRVLVGAIRDAQVAGHALRSDTSAIWVSLRSTLHFVDAVLFYTARVQGCAGLKTANIFSILHWKFCSVKGGQIWSSTCPFILYWRPLEAIGNLWVPAPVQKHSMCLTLPTIPCNPTNRHQNVSTVQLFSNKPCAGLRHKVTCKQCALSQEWLYMPSKTQRGAQEPQEPHRRTEKLHTKPRPRLAVGREVTAHNAVLLSRPRAHCVPVTRRDPRHAAVWWDQVPVWLCPPSFCF